MAERKRPKPRNPRPDKVRAAIARARERRETGDELTSDNDWDRPTNAGVDDMTIVDAYFAGTLPPPGPPAWVDAPTASGHYWWLLSPKGTPSMVYYAKTAQKVVGAGFTKTLDWALKKGGKFQGPLRPDRPELAFAPAAESANG